jgi:hypothetical protein
MRAEIFVHKPHQRRRLLLFFFRFVCKYLCKNNCLLGAQPEKHLNACQFAYICNSHHVVVISKNKLNKYISFLLALPGWLYHVTMVASCNEPFTSLQAEKNHCSFWSGDAGWSCRVVAIYWLGFGLGLDMVVGLQGR